jgi:hypothetical protein
VKWEGCKKGDIRGWTGLGILQNGCHRHGNM